MQMKHGILVIAIALVAGCASTALPTDQSDAVRRYEFRVQANSVAPERARRIALQYMALFHPVEFDGDVIEVDRCSDLEASGDCDYLIHHWGKGCEWGSKVQQQCVDGNCTYSLSDPFETGMTVCE